MESRPEEPESTQFQETAGNSPSHEDVTVRQNFVAENHIGENRNAENAENEVQGHQPGELADDLGAEEGSVSEGTNEAQFAGAKTVISKPRSSPIPAHPGTQGEPAKIASVLLGHQLGHFELQSLIGGGGMGAVFRARDTRLDRTVAIKVIPRVGEDAELRRRFRNEAQSAARLEHPNIARIYDVGEDGGWHYIVFEYIEGINLRDLVVRDGVLGIDDAVFYTRQIAEALDHASRKGVTHRDIKPSNVLITPDGAVKLVDMGLARAQQIEMTDDMTASGVTLGTFDYISPEQAKDPRDADVRSDIYSLGCTLFFSLTGRPPYGGGTPLQKLLSHGSSPLPDPNLYRSGVSESLVAILFKMMAKDPAARYRRPLDLIADLYQLAERENLTRSLSAGSITVVPGNRFLKLLETHLPWVIAASILLLSVGWLQLLSSASSELELSEPLPTQQTSSRGRGGDAPRNGGRQDAPSAANPSAAENASTLGPSVASGAPGATTVNGSQTTIPLNPADDSSNPSRFDATKPPDLGPLLGAPQVDMQADSFLGGNSDSNPSLDASSEQGIRKIVRVVEPEVNSQSRGESKETWLVNSLQEAIDMAVEDPRIEVIEIGAQRIRSGPVRIPPRPLTIRGTTSSTVLEMVVPDDRIEQERLTMIEMGASSLSIEKLHMLWRLPSNASEGGAFFRIPDSRGNTTLRFQECSLTIDNTVGHPDIFALELKGGGEAETDRASLAAETTGSSEIGSSGIGTTIPLVAIKMSDVIVRGQITMLSISRPTRLEFLWENGLLAVDGGLLACAGTASASTVSTSPTRLRFILNDLTSSTGESLIQMRIPAGQFQPYFVDREANRCVFTLDEDIPLVSIDAIGEGASVQDFVVLRGRDNYYDAAEGRTQLILRAETNELQQVSFETQGMFLSERPRWVQELSPQDFVSWKKTVPPNRPSHLAVPAEYLQDGVVLPGFRVEKLPTDLPEFGESEGTGI